MLQVIGDGIIKVRIRLSKLDDLRVDLLGLRKDTMEDVTIIGADAKHDIMYHIISY